jgi:RNA polymerase sigma-70 factor (ECF subfamily)
METPASLLERLRQPADQAAWSQFVRLYAPLLYHWAGRLGLREADAADLVQDVLLVLVRKLSPRTAGNLLSRWAHWSAQRTLLPRGPRRLDRRVDFLLW